MYVVTLSFIAGLLAASLHFQAALFLVKYVLQPHEQVFVVVPEDPGASLLFPLRLFVLAFLTVGMCASTAHTQSSNRKFILFLIQVSASLFLTAIALTVYRQHMQEPVEFRIGEQSFATVKGRMTRLGDVPIVELGLIGPIVACVGTIATRRKRSTSCSV